MSKGYNDNPINNSRHVSDQLSDYMDGLLAGDARAAVRAHLEECTDCRADYVELRAAQKLVQTMPLVQVPRNFTLTPEMAGQVSKPSFWERLLTPSNSPRLATGSVVAFMLLFLVMAGNLGIFRSSVATFSKVSSGLSEGYSAPGSSAKMGSTESASERDASVATAPVAPDAMAVPQPTEAQSTDGLAAGSPAGAADAEPSTMSAIATPNSDVTSSANSSPTTTGLENIVPPPAGGAAGSSQFVQADTGQDRTSPTPTGADALWTIAPIALLALALALGVAAFIARRGIGG